MVVALLMRKNNARDIIFFTNCWYGEWLLINEKNDINGGPRWKSIRV